MAGIYIHIPFCRQACHYCNFHFSVSHRQRDAFLDALVREIRMQRSFFTDLAEKGLHSSVETVYLGGGTPSLLGVGELMRIFEELNNSFSLDKVEEITLEANPDDLVLPKLRSLKSTPVNRLSIGVQSFHPSDLKYMNRLHSTTQAYDSIRHAREMGFDNLSVDLIYGTPGLSDGMWEKNLQSLLDLDIPHISAYALTLEEKTTLAFLVGKGRTPAPDEEQAARQFHLMCKMLSSAGYTHYELSNFARGGHMSKHNLIYWTGKHYLGLGPSAHSCKMHRRSWNPPNTQKYIDSLMQGKLIPEGEDLSDVQQLNEYLMTSLRTIWGCRLDLLAERWGMGSVEAVRRNAVKHLAGGRLVEMNDTLLLTREGMFFADGIASDLFLEGLL